MIVFYDPQTLRIGHVVTAFSEEYRAFVQTQPNWLETSLALPVWELAVVMQDGTPVAIARPAATVTISSEAVAAGEVVTLSGLDVGAALSIGGPYAASGTASGATEALTFTVPGTYRVTVDAYPKAEAVFVVEVNE